MRLALMFGAAATLLAASAPSAATREGVAHAFADIGPGQPGCSVATVLNGRPDFAGGFGLADIGTGRAITADTLFEVASLSKQFTAFAVLLLEKQGRLKLSDPVRKYVPELGAYADPITVGDLIHHTSGLRDASVVMMTQDNASSLSQADIWSDASTLAVLGRQKAGETPPRTAQLYNNTNYRLLAIVAERAGGKPLQQQLSEAVFKPLGMTSTFIGDADPARLREIAANYAVANGQFRSLPTAPAAVGAGGVRTTANDFARWLENFWTGQAGGKDVMRKMAEVPRLPDGAPVDYGGGVTLAAYRGLERLEHGGSWDGFRSKMAVYPAQRFGVVVLCNRSDAGTTPRIDDVSDVYLGGLMKAAKAESSEVLQLRPLKGIAAAKAPLGAYRDKVGAEYLRIVAGPGDTRVLDYRGERRTLNLVEPGIYKADALTPFPGFDIYVAFDAKGLNMSYGGDYDRFDHVEDWAPGDLSRYAGTYWSDEAQAHMTLSVKDGALYAQMGARSAPLKPGRRGEFAFGRGGLEVPAEGPADELKVELYGLRGMVYRRVATPTS